MDWLSIKETIKDTIKLLLVIIVIFLIMMYVVSISQVVGKSMNSTLQDKDVLVLDKISYRFKDIKRGDIVHLNYSDTKYLIKRVIGLPGEHLSIKNNQVYINGEVLEEDYLDKDLVYSDFNLEDIGYSVIPKDFYFVLGDNRTDGKSIDSREIGLISKDDINGRILLRFWPINKAKFF